MPRPTLLKKIAEVALRTISGYGEDRVSISAAGITYFTLISIFPMALVGLSIAGFVYGGEGDQQRLLDDIMDQLPIDESGGRDDLESVITSIVEARGTLGVIGILSALYTGSALFTAVRVALNGIFRGEKSRPFFIGKLIDIGMVALLGTVLLVSVAASFLVTVFSGAVDDVVGSDGANLTRLGVTAVSLLLPPVISTGVFLLLYAKVPAAAVRWKHALPGAILAAVLFEVLKVGFGIYAANFTNYDATYGSLGFVILLLAFVYFAAQVVLLGAETARATAEVADGWPLPDDQSKVAGLRARFSSMRAKLRRVMRQEPSPSPTPSLPVTIHGPAPESELPAPPAAEHPAAPSAVQPVPHSGPRSTGWIGAAALFGGVALAAFAVARRR